MRREPVNPWSWQDRWGYTQAWSVSGGRHVFVSGQGAFDEEGRLLHPGDLARQVPLALANLEAVLVAAGASVGDVVKVNGYVTDLAAFQSEIGAGFVRFFGERGVRPALTVVEVSRLGVEGMEIEVEATAVVDEPDQPAR